MGVQLSYEHRSVYVEEGGTSESKTQYVNELLDQYSPMYDFYLTTDTQNAAATTHHHAGWDFCKEIISDVNNISRDPNTSNDIGPLSLSVDPRSAVEYCYNRNKRNENGTIDDDKVVWYLPALDEIENIVMSQYGLDLKSYAYSRFPDFRAKPYWSSQPAYWHNYVHVDRTYGVGIGSWAIMTDGDRVGDFMIDNVEYARTTSVSYNGLGADNPKNYTPISSGMDGYYQLMYIYVYEPMIGSDTIEKSVQQVPETGLTVTYKAQGNYGGTVTLDYPSPHPGYRKRADAGKDSMARVRCVRRNQ